MASGRTTKRVQCPGCGQLLRPTRDMLLGRGALGCACGFGAGSPAPKPFEVPPPPRRGPTVTLLGAGFALFSAGLVAQTGVVFGTWSVPGAVAATLGGAGAAGLAWGGWWWWCRRRWFDSARLCEDPAIRRALMTQVRQVWDHAERNATGQVMAFLAERGITAPEFRNAVLARLDDTGPAA